MWDSYQNAIFNTIEDLDPNKFVLFTTCSHGKPYGKSHIHYVLRNYLAKVGLMDKLEQWHLSSAGVIPHVMHEEYPYAHYDWNNEWATPETLTLLRDSITSRLAEWWSWYGPTKLVFFYLREDSNTLNAVREFVRTNPTVQPLIYLIIARELDREVEQVRLGMISPDSDDHLLNPLNLDTLRIYVAHEINRAEVV
jgi:hypothetical protein